MQKPIKANAQDCTQPHATPSHDAPCASVDEPCDASQDYSQAPRSTLAKAFRYAFEGFIYTLRSQRNMRIHLVIAFCILLLCVLLRLTAVECAVILICIGLVLMTEMLNTAIEATIDLVSPEYHLLAKRAKDIGAGMVLMFSLLSVIVGCIIFGSALLRLFG